MNTFITCVGGQANFDACIDWHYLMVTCHMPQQEALAFDGQLRVFEYDVRPMPFGGEFSIATLMHDSLVSLYHISIYTYRCN
jgi:hypothetical protein